MQLLENLVFVKFLRFLFFYFSNFIYVCITFYYLFIYSFITFADSCFSVQVDLSGMLKFDLLFIIYLFIYLFIYYFLPTHFFQYRWVYLECLNLTLKGAVELQ